MQNLTVDHLQYTNMLVINGYPVEGYKYTQGQRPWIGNKQPVLGWNLNSKTRGVTQTAYRIIISDHKDSVIQETGAFWDSGKVKSAESTNIIYKGKSLEANTKYYWRVMVWDTNEHPSEWSSIHEFWTAKELVDYHTASYPLLKTDEKPKYMQSVGDTHRIDFGKAAFGQLRISLISKNDTLLTIRLGEAIQTDGSIQSNPGGTIRYAEYQLKLKKGFHTYQLQFQPDKRNTGTQAILMPDDIGEVLPFRYVELQGYDGTLEDLHIVRSSVHYPFDDFASYFESSDSVLNAVWELCKYSIKATSFAGIYVDGDRERIPYEADAYINQLSHYGVDREYSMARRSHEYLLHHATWPTEWILQSVLMAYNDYLYTGDIRSVQFYYEDLKAKLLLPLRENNDLISTRTGKQTRKLMEAIHYNGDSLHDIVDWPHTGGFGMEGNGETDGFVFTDYNAVVNAFHYKALCDMVVMAEVLGYREDALLFKSQAAKTYQAFQSLLWNKKKSAYQDGVDTDHTSLHTNMLAIAFGLVPHKNKNKVMKFIRSRGMVCSVYGSQFLLDAIYEGGDSEYGLSLLTSQSDRSWYNMIRAGSTMTMEAWDNKYKPNQDWNHAWGAVPANVIPRKLMGIEPLTPGWSMFRIRPQIGTLKSAKIKVPTIKGFIELACTQDSSMYHMEFNVPVNTVAQIELPLQIKGKPVVYLNGELIDFKLINGVLEINSLMSGNYALKINYSR